MTYTHVEYIFVHISFLMLLLVTLPNLLNLFYEIDRPNHFSKNSMTIAFLCLTGFMAIRCFQTKHLPLGNSYESLIFLSWGFSLLYPISNSSGKTQGGLPGAVLAPSAMLTHAFATSSLPQEMQQSTSLVPASQSHRLMMHVTTTLISYATSSCGSLLAIVLLSLLRGKRNNYYSLYLEHNSEKRICLLNPFNNIQRQINVQSSPYSLFLNSRKCQLINCLDKWTYQAISLGFSFLTVGILSGAVWANEARGSYRSWDPKETWALVTWLIYATYLHTRINERWTGEKPAVAASMGFFLVRIRFLGVNLLGIGLHNYGWLV
uniref:Cytochrome c biogenesis protein CcsA n=1 Tax=Cryptogramma acrostichoides TaxID=414624 RepID=A0A3G5CSE7_9MONI|nr:cytochrome c heme attachment protein [Cryptogramma acrostichoides]AYW15776.1 cytochrome c heme attachment protein [Cryptogramma acrostichoides]